MNFMERRISSLSRTKKKDQSLKKLLICLKNALKILTVILLLSSATADDSGLHDTIHLEKCFSYTNRMLILLDRPRKNIMSPPVINSAMDFRNKLTMLSSFAENNKASNKFFFRDGNLLKGSKGESDRTMKCIMTCRLIFN